MDYFEILNLSKEPFSNSPDPDFFFQSRQHIECLQKLELSLRLRRGLNIVIGDVGTGKTTLCRQLIRQFAQDDAIETHLILDPNFSTPSEFLSAIAEMFERHTPKSPENDWQLKEVIKQHLFLKGVEQEKTVILIIDEGQKIPEFCFEILREFLNYETNQFKLLQIVIFAQKELDNRLAQYPNFTDRINLKHQLGPMTFSDTRAMIQFRLDQSSHQTSGPTLFSRLALWTIYRKTGGYPRKIINLCHRCILTMIVQNRSRIGWQVIRSCDGRSRIEGRKAGRRVAAAAIAAALVFTIAAALSMEKIKRGTQHKLQVKIASPRNNDDLSPPVSPRKKHLAVLTEPRAVETPKPADVKASQTNNGGGPAPQVVAAASAVSLPKRPEAERNYPSTLGTVTLQRNETLWRLLKKVYGICNLYRLNKLLKVNPAIKNPDHVERGQVIRLPGIPVRVEAGSTDGWWVEVEKMDHLESAIEFLRSYPDDAPAVRMIPYWNSKEGLRFSILVQEIFKDRPSADNRLREMPRSLSKGLVRNAWDKDTVFFADPAMKLKKY